MLPTKSQIVMLSPFLRIENHRTVKNYLLSPSSTMSSIRKAFVLAISFYFYVLVFLLVVVTVACFLFSVTFISRQYTVNRIFVQSALKQRQDVVVFFCFLLISTSFNSIEKYFYHSFLYLLSTLFM